jgi:hypothetical protein
LSVRDFAISPLPRWAERLWAEVGLAVALGLALAVLGPFRTSESDPLQRIGFWIGLSALWFVIVMAIDSLVDRASFGREIGGVQRLALKVAIAAVPMLAFVTLAVQALFHFTPDWHKVLHLYPRTLLIGAGLTLVSSALFSGPLRTIDRRTVPEPGKPASPPEPVPPLIEANPLQARLPAHLRGQILCLQTEDHYVRIHTAQGSALVLMRMSDAVAAMGEMGMRVHRSWWIARDAVRSCSRSGRTLRIELANGLVVPVSQPYARAAREALGMT